MYKNIYALFFLAFLTNCKTNFYINNEDMVEQINSMNTTWKAGLNQRFAGVTKSAFSFLLGVLPDDTEEKVYKDITPRDDLPENFDLRTQYPNCESLQEIRDQGSCGSCWAFGAAEAMSDRICIKSEGKYQTRISSVHLVSCCTSCGNGCHGGFPYSAFTYWVKKGIPTGGMYGDTTTCKPYVFEPCEHHQIPGPHGPCDIEYRPTPKCEDKCIDGYEKTVEEDLWYGDEAYYVSSNEEKIKTEIYENGSVEAAFTVYEDFVLYKEGVYQHVTGSRLGGHAIKIVGWGVEDGVKYWICVNSWNEDWGDKGTFKILRGSNHLGIESGVVAGTPLLPKETDY